MSISNSELKQIEIVLNLLQGITTINVVSEFLKSRGIHHSASSWVELRTKRIMPAVEQGILSYSNLLDLLGMSEECGNQHVFLYKLAKTTATKCLNRQAIDEVIKKLDLGSLPRLLVKPENPTISDVRLEPDTAPAKALTIKVVSTVLRKEKIVDETIKDIQTIKYRNVPERSVNLLKLHQDGFVEVRIQSHSGPKNSYQLEINNIGTSD